jgi:hypothetical protein
MCCVNKWLLIACHRSYVWVCGCWMDSILYQRVEQYTSNLEEEKLHAIEC